MISLVHTICTRAAADPPRHTKQPGHSRAYSSLEQNILFEGGSHPLARIQFLDKKYVSLRGVLPHESPRGGGHRVGPESVWSHTHKTYIISYIDIYRHVYKHAYLFHVIFPMFVLYIDRLFGLDLARQTCC